VDDTNAARSTAARRPAPCSPLRVRDAMHAGPGAAGATSAAMSGSVFGNADLRSMMPGSQNIMTVAVIITPNRLIPPQARSRMSIAISCVMSVE
jgi:hypothetical protein